MSKKRKPGNNWEKLRFVLPKDDYDEDDEIDERLNEIERKRKNHVVRGRFFGTQ